LALGKEPQGSRGSSPFGCGRENQAVSREGELLRKVLEKRGVGKVRKISKAFGGTGGGGGDVTSSWGRLLVELFEKALVWKGEDGMIGGQVILVLRES